jgi:hypothetical protein
MKNGIPSVRSWIARTSDGEGVLPRICANRAVVSSSESG